MAIDISHSGERTALETIEASVNPVFLSHGGARALTRKGALNYNRMAPDSVLEAVGESGGVVGIEAAPHQTISVDHPVHDIDAVMDHFEYCLDLLGIDHVAFGPDTMFGDHVGVHHAFSDQLAIEEESDYQEVPYVKGMENPGENFSNITKWLIKHGYTDEEIEKVVGGNIINALRRVWVK
jgi:membrane dipeptidase